MFSFYVFYLGWIEQRKYFDDGFDPPFPGETSGIWIFYIVFLRYKSLKNFELPYDQRKLKN